MRPRPTKGPRVPRPEAARVAGLDVARYNRLLAVLTAVVGGGAMQIVGVILVAAMLVIPVATATPVNGFKRSVLAAIGAGGVATVTGVTLSYRYDVAAGGTIVLVAIAGYLAAVLGDRARRRFLLDRPTPAKDTGDGST